MSAAGAAGPPAVAAAPAAVAAAPPQKILNAEGKVGSAVSALGAATTARDKAKEKLDLLEKAVKTAAAAHDDANAAEQKLLDNLVEINNNIKSKNVIIKNLNTKTSNANITKVNAAKIAYKDAAAAASDAPNNNAKQQNAVTKLASYKAAKAAAESAGAALEAAKAAALAATTEKTALEARKAAIDKELSTASALEKSTKAALEAAQTATVEPKGRLDEANLKVKGLEEEKVAANAALKNAQLENSTTKGTSYNNKAGITTSKFLGRTVTTTDKIIEAAKTGNDTMLAPLLKAITDVATNQPILNRALYAAAEFPSLACVNQLITKGANVTINKNGASILHAAISSLDKYKTNAKLQDKINNVIEIITSVNNANKYVINIKNKNGETVLHLAAKSPLKGSDKIVDTILSFKSDKNYVNTKNTKGKTALQFIHNQNATKINFRGREGRYPMYNVNFKKAAALLDKGATVPTGTKGIEIENAQVYPALMKYYRKLNTMSGETANIEKIKTEAEAAAATGARGSVFTRNAQYYNNLAKRLTAQAGYPGTSNIKKEKYIRRAAKATQYAQSIRNARAKEAATKAASGITGVRKGLFGYTNNTSRARAVAAAAAAQTVAARAQNAAAARAAAAAAAPPRKKLFGFFGGTRKNRSRKNKSTRKNRKH